MISTSMSNLLKRTEQSSVNPIKHDSMSSIHSLGTSATELVLLSEA